MIMAIILASLAIFLALWIIAVLSGAIKYKDILRRMLKIGAFAACFLFIVTTVLWITG